MDAHGSGSNQHVVEFHGLERAEHTEDFVAVHVG
jgi:hypothetical protein